MPHQQSLIDLFVEGVSMRGCIARWAPGLGLTVATIHLVARVRSAHPEGRILVIGTSKVLQTHLKQSFSRVGVDAEIVDRYRFRELQDTASPDESVWRAGGIYIVGFDLAVLDDVADGLVSVPWTLLVIPEPDRINLQRQEVMRELISRSPRVRVLLHGQPGEKQLPDLGIESWMENTVSPADLLDMDGRQLVGASPVVINMVRYDLTEPERRNIESVSKVLRAAPTIEELRGLPGTTIARKLTSSPASLERILRRYRNRLVHGDRASDGVPEDEEADTVDLPSTIPVNLASFLEAVDTCIADLDSVNHDSKLLALQHLLRQQQETSEASTAICIVTEFRSTLLYLQAALEESGLAPITLHSAMQFEQRSEALRMFGEQRGLFITTNAMLKGLDLPYVDSLVIYDAARSVQTLMHAYYRFQRLQRKTPLTLNLLISSELDTEQADAIEALVRGHEQVANPNAL